jgi:hypothetical protein
MSTATDDIQSRLDRIERMLRGQSQAVPDDASLTYEEAAIFFVTGENPHWMSEEELERARALLADHQMSARTMRRLCMDETLRFPYRVKSGQSAIVPATAVKEYKRRLREDAVKAQHRVEP